jgi:hypothetical protein
MAFGPRSQRTGLARGRGYAQGALTSTAAASSTCMSSESRPRRTVAGLAAPGAMISSLGNTPQR